MATAVTAAAPASDPWGGPSVPPAADPWGGPAPGGLRPLRGPQLTLGVGPQPLRLERGLRLTHGEALMVSATTHSAAAFLAL
jgi:hypothetical protein